MLSAYKKNHSCFTTKIICPDSQKSQALKCTKCSLYENDTINTCRKELESINELYLIFLDKSASFGIGSIKEAKNLLLSGSTIVIIIDVFTIC